MDSYYCIIGTVGAGGAELCVLNAPDRPNAPPPPRAAGEGVAGWVQARVYAGERLVGTIERVAPPGELPLAA